MAVTITTQAIATAKFAFKQILCMACKTHTSKLGLQTMLGMALYITQKQT
jgi:hypothetical protein